MYVEITTSNGAITLNSNVIKPWWSAFFAITAAQNVLTTSLLVWRIWRVEHQNARYRATGSASAPIRQPRLNKVIRVVAESGAAYSSLVFMTFIVSVCNSNALYPLSDATLQWTGVTFNTIIIRSTPRRDEQFTVFDHNERGTVAPPAEGPVSAPIFSRLQFVSHPNSDQSKTVDNSNGINITIKSTTDRLDDIESQADAYYMKDMKDIPK